MLKTALLLTLSNIFMTFAWYGHLKWFPKGSEANTAFPLKIIVISWLIAFFEYCFQVPANRAGERAGMNLGQLKITQEVITLTVFTVFSLAFMGEKLHWRFYAAFALMLGAVALVFMGKK